MDRRVFSVGGKEVTLYVTDSPDRSHLLDEYFTAHATGRNVPVSHIKPQPAKPIITARLLP